MIITVTLNAAIDKSLAVPNFRLGRRHRTVEQRTMAGGKGVNIARTLKALGQPVIATGFAGGATGTHIVEQLTEESILNDFVRIREESRTNTSVLDPTTGAQTEINERGPSVTAREVELFRDKLLYLARGAAIVVFAGSLPRGVEADLYGSLVHDLERSGVTTVVDTDGEPMRHAVRAEPDLVSPNVLEAEELVGHEFATDEERTLAMSEIAELGPREVIMTLPDGALAQVLVDGERTPQAPSLRHVANTKPGDLRRLQRQQVFSAQQDGAGSGPHQPHDRLAERGFAHAIAADDGKYAGVQRHVDALQSVRATVVDVEAPDLENRSCAARISHIFLQDHGHLPDKAPAPQDRIRFPAAALP